MYVSHHRDNFRALTAALLAAVLVLGLFVVLPFTNHLDARRPRSSGASLVASSSIRRFFSGSEGSGMEVGTLGRGRAPTPGPVLEKSENSPARMPEIVLQPMPVDETQGVPVSASLALAQIFEASDLDFAPVVLYRTVPVYPPELRRSGVEGRAVITFRVDEDGRVCDVKIREASHPDFAQALLDAVVQWRFMPGTIGGERVSFRMIQPVSFSLNTHDLPQLTEQAAAFEQ